MAYFDRINLSANGFYKTPDLAYDWFVIIVLLNITVGRRIKGGCLITLHMALLVQKWRLMFSLGITLYFALISSWISEKV